jgi:hypothetical protein
VAVYLILAILYESYVHPITIISCLPAASVGALLALQLPHTGLSIIAIIGIILLIGGVKKNAIMMIDFALAAQRNEGKNSYDSIVEACLLRFRPIVMTTIAALLGALPLALGTGTGWIRTSPSAWNYHHRRAGHEPTTDVIHDTGGLPTSTASNIGGMGYALENPQRPNQSGPVQTLRFPPVQVADSHVL